MESIQFIQWCLNNLDYWTITLLMTIESSFIPFPSEIVVPPAAYKAYIGELNIYLVIFFSTLGALLGAFINYFLAIWLGRPIIYKFVGSRLGHALLLNEETVEKAENYFKKHGAISTLVGRLIPAIRQLISIPAGLAKMKLSKFILYTSLGAGLWNIVLAALGYFLPYFYPAINSKEKLISEVSLYSKEIGIVIIVLVVLALGFVLYKALKKNKQ